MAKYTIEEVNIIAGPAGRSNHQARRRPVMLKSRLSIDEAIIIFQSELLNFSAIAAGIVSRAITIINPVTFISTIVVRAAIIRNKPRTNHTGTP